MASTLTASHNPRWLWGGWTGVSGGKVMEEVVVVMVVVLVVLVGGGAGARAGAGGGGDGGGGGGGGDGMTPIDICSEANFSY